MEAHLVRVLLSQKFIENWLQMSLPSKVISIWWPAQTNLGNLKRQLKIQFHYGLEYKHASSTLHAKKVRSYKHLV